jgi:hypothetical protein
VIFSRRGFLMQRSCTFLARSASIRKCATNVLLTRDHRISYTIELAVSTCDLVIFNRCERGLLMLRSFMFLARLASIRKSATNVLFTRNHCISDMIELAVYPGGQVICNRRGLLIQRSFMFLARFASIQKCATNVLMTRHHRVSDTIELADTTEDLCCNADGQGG